MTSDKSKDSKASFEGQNIADTSVSDRITEAFDTVQLSTIGKMCLDARVKKSLTQEQASSMLKLRVKIIKDFENGDEIDLPGLTYKVGFVRSYARLLDLDGDYLVQEYTSSIELDGMKEEYNFLTPRVERKKLLPLGAILSFFVALIIYSGWYYSERIETVESQNSDIAIKKFKNYEIIQENKNKFEDIIITQKQDESLQVSSLSKEMLLTKEKKDLTEVLGNSNSTISNVKVNEKIILKDDIKPNTNTSENISSELSAIATERDPSSEMIIKALGNSWIEIEDIDGHIVMTRLMRPGETYVVPKKSGLTFNTGNAGGLSLSYGNVKIPSLGKVGEIISARPLNIEAFRDKQIIN
jgi:cytoskeleton protein RodZ